MRKKLIAEFLGTYFFVFAGTGAIVVNELTKSLSHIGVALTFGLTLTAVVFTFGHISGAHINPAITIGFLFKGDINKKDALYYILAQVIGGILASVTICQLFGKVASLGATLPSGSTSQSFALEFILTFFLMIVIFGSAVHMKASKSVAGIAIGSTLALEAMFGGPISGASMNPARSLGPAIVSGNYDAIWIYIVATILGAICAAFIYKFLHE
jgi:MIP family channel proteins